MLCFPLSNRSYFPISLLAWLLETLNAESLTPKKIGVLYDIGCSFEKSINKVSLSGIEALSRLHLRTVILTVLRLL